MNVADLFGNLRKNNDVGRDRGPGIRCIIIVNSGTDKVPLVT